MNHSKVTPSPNPPSPSGQETASTAASHSTQPAIASWNYAPPTGPRRRIEDAKRQEVYGVLGHYLKPRGFEKIESDEFPIPGFEYGFEKNGIVVGCVNTPFDVNIFVAMPSFAAEEDLFFRYRVFNLGHMSIPLPYWYSRLPIRCTDRETVRENLGDILTLIDLAEKKYAEYEEKNGHSPRTHFWVTAMSPSKRVEMKEKRWDAERRYIISRVQNAIAAVGMAVGFFAIPPALESGFKNLPPTMLVETHMFFDRMQKHREKGLLLQVPIDIGTGALPGGIIGLGLGTAAGAIIASQRRKSHAKLDQGYVDELVEDPEP